MAASLDLCAETERLMMQIKVESDCIDVVTIEPSGAEERDDRLFSAVLTVSKRRSVL